MSEMEELVRLPDPLVQPLVHPVDLPDSRVVRLQRLYPKSVVKAPVSTVLVPRPQTAVVGGRPLAGVALLEWARTVIDTVLDTDRSTQQDS